MKKYGIDFAPFIARPGWYATADTVASFATFLPIPDPAERMAYYARIEEHDRKIERTVAIAHREADFGSDLLFLGRFEPEAVKEEIAPRHLRLILPRRIFLIPATHPADVAKEFKLGSHAASYLGNDLVDKTYAALKDLYGIAPFTPTFMDVAGLHARFVTRIDRETAEYFLEALNNHDGPGLEGWGDEEDDQHIIDKFVQEQKFRLWWD